jgi:hypothetical protein
MKKLKYLLFTIVSIVVFSGCSGKYPITYNSNPTGALVVCNGVNHGYTPLTLYYEPDDKAKEYGKMRTELCTANWLSGVQEEYSRIWDLEEYSNGVMQTLQRPSGDGYEKDVQFALQVQQMKAQQAQAQAAQMSAFAAQQQANQQALQNVNQNIQNSWNDTQMQFQNIQMQNLNNNLNNLNRNLNGGGYQRGPQW